MRSRPKASRLVHCNKVRGVRWWSVFCESIHIGVSVGVLPVGNRYSSKLHLGMFKAGKGEEKGMVGDNEAATASARQERVKPLGLVSYSERVWRASSFAAIADETVHAGAHRLPRKGKKVARPSLCSINPTPP